MTVPFRDIRSARLTDEVGTIFKQAELPFALCYPSPYAVGMSSLGYQTIYRRLNGMAGVSAERAFLPDDAGAARFSSEPLRTYESSRPVGDFPVVAFSVAYELELAGLVTCLDLAGIPAFADERRDRPERFPLIVVGGPLTFSNPVPAAPYADVLLLGEAEETIVELCEAFRDTTSREALLERLASRPGFYVPPVHGERPPAVAAADDTLLPAYSQIRTPHTELANMFLIEPERGCHRGCTYCVMRRSTNGGMRMVEPERVKALIPGDARRVGLVGAAVTDHPGLPEILRFIVDGGRGVGISSLRADRLNDEIVGLLRRGGYRTLTTAADGSSERLRDVIQRKTRERHLLRAAQLARAHGMQQLKLYMMVGLPGETDADIDELGRFGLELAAAAGRLVLGIAPFVAKRKTPLDGAPFEAIDVLDDRLERLRAAVKGRVTLRPTSPKWAWVEYRLAQGGFAAGRAAARAARAGGRFADWKAALAEVEQPPVVATDPPDRRRALPQVA
ncbi:MAG TPA: radical SAM protein [Polyangia bacterium]|nr:radical SAM protein [Polyangia bacterium]